jgi:hypothetical protein
MKRAAGHSKSLPAERFTAHRIVALRALTKMPQANWHFLGCVLARPHIRNSVGLP